ncbi:tripartite tricarboxylate transporter substrate binding protein [Roseomonas sp. NAR14]|uniref:Tripartite tricarboxylate transporter substrate binding protein n=1 Tax=Roseomonas acroporae TaxID=2937791 RepID=A0A9X1YCB4_9PROT|nr:tripartite tricarboxylate transporter substrate binding protein [Roseomonas acroporae]MCK8786092.1 tripartite tricarboxylate transporter substrate binding protein [Roseomonas acroporae]
MTSRRRIIHAALAAGAGLATPFSRPALAQPDRAPLVILVPFAAGGPADQMARAIGSGVAGVSGRTVVVDNRPGAGGQIAATALLHAPANGRTLLIGDMGHLAYNGALFRNLSYDPLTDLAPVAGCMAMPVALFVPADSPARSLGQLVEAGRQRDLAYASQSTGSPGHILGEMLRGATGMRLTHVPYRGSAPAMTDLIGGRVDLLFDGIGAGLPYLAAGKLRVLAVATPERLPLLPDIPTTAEAGLEQLRMSVWFGLAARSGTPASVVEEVYRPIAEALRMPALVGRFEEQGFVMTPMGPEAFAPFVRSEAERWGAVIRRYEIRLD